MGLFDDFGIDADDVEAPSFSNPDDGFYGFEITEGLIQEGTKKKPDDTFFIIKYNLDEAGEKQEWFTTAQDGELTERALQSLGYLKNRLTDLGLDPKNTDPEDLEGIRGVLQLVTTKNAKGEFQNVRKVTLEEEPEKPAKAKQSAKKPAAKAKKAVSDDENPFEDD